MYLIKNYSKMGLMPLLLVMIIAGCDNEDGITTPSNTQYNVTLSSNPVAGGTTTGNGKFDSDASVTITATPNSGYTFTNWTGNGAILATTSSYTFTVSANIAVVANFFAVSTVVQPPVTLGSTSQFAILSSSDITNIPTSGTYPKVS